MSLIQTYIDLVLHREEYCRIGKALMLAIRTNTLNRDQFRRDIGCSGNQYYSVLKLLLNSKIIIKCGRNYSINPHFIGIFVEDWVKYANET